MLTNIMYKQRMGQGNGESYSPKNPEWNYSPPNSLIESILKAVCKHWTFYPNLSDRDTDFAVIRSFLDFLDTPFFRNCFLIVENEVAFGVVR